MWLLCSLWSYPPNYPRDQFLHVKSHPFSLKHNDLSHVHDVASKASLFSIYIGSASQPPPYQAISKQQFSRKRRKSNKKIAANFITPFTFTLNVIRVPWALISCLQFIYCRNDMYICVAILNCYGYMVLSCVCSKVLGAHQRRRKRQSNRRERHNFV